MAEVSEQELFEVRRIVCEFAEKRKAAKLAEEKNKAQIEERNMRRHAEDKNRRHAREAELMMPIQIEEEKAKQNRKEIERSRKSYARTGVSARAKTWMASIVPYHADGWIEN